MKVENKTVTINITGTALKVTTKGIGLLYKATKALVTDQKFNIPIPVLEPKDIDKAAEVINKVVDKVKEVKSNIVKGIKKQIEIGEKVEKALENSSSLKEKIKGLKELKKELKEVETKEVK